MAHGFLTPQEVSGESPLFGKIAEWLKKQWDKRNKQANVIETKVSDIEKDVALLADKPAARMLGYGKTKGLLTGGGGTLAKNPTDIDVKTGRRAPSGGPNMGGKGGAIANLPISPPSGGGGLNADAFFTKGTGFDYDRVYEAVKAGTLTASQAREIKRSTNSGAPSITPDSGADIVAAVNKNTEAIVRLVGVTKDQTANDSNLVQQQIQAQNTLMSRSAARAEENALEQGSDLSGFMTPENFAKRKKNEEKKETGSKLKEFFRGPNPFKQQEGCGCSPILGGGGGVGVPDYVRQKGKTMGRPSRLGGGASVMRRGGGGKAITRGLAKTFGRGAAKGAAKGLGKMGLKKIPGVGAVAGAAFAAERAMKGDWLGAGGELLSGLAGTIPGIGTGVSAAIDAGLMARDAGLTPFAQGGIVTQPTAGLVGEAGKEGVFPLEGTRGKKTFKMFGEGLINAQLDNKDDFAKIQSRGLKQYYETEGGFQKMGNIFGEIFKGIGNVLGSIGNSIFGGAANAAGLGAGGGFNTQNLASFIGGLESGNDYTKMVGGAQDASVLGKTISQLSAEKGDKFAMGRYQIQMATAKDVLRGAGIDASTFKFDQAGQDKIFELLLKRRGIDDFMSGKITKDQFAKNLSKEWAALPTDASGRGYYDGVGTNKSLTSYSSVLGQLDTLKQTGSPFKVGSGGGSAGVLAKTAESLKGFSTRVRETDYGKNGCVYAVNKVFNAAGITPPWGSSLYVPDAEKSMQKAGWQQVPYNQAQPGDVFVMKDRKSPPQAHIGIMQTNGKILSNSSGDAAMTWEGTIDYYNNYYGGQGVLYRMPGTSVAAASNPPPSNTPPAVAAVRRQTNGGRRGSGSSPGSLQASATPSPSPVPASPVSANTGTPMMAASQQVAMGTMGLTTGGGTPTIINNYYGGGQQQTGVNPNGVSAGIGMEQTGTAIFQDLRIRALA